MRISTTVIIVLALVTAPASAGDKRNRGGDDNKNEAKTSKVDEKAYKAALERIPEPKEKYDPWGIARPAEPTKTQK